MNRSICLGFLLAIGGLSTGAAFQSAASRVSSTPSSSSSSRQQPPRPTLSSLMPRSLKKNDDTESLIPETSFGADAVPEGQRPVNEYLEVTRQPLFGWASLDTPDFLVRLGIVYAVVFGAVCWPISGATYTQEGYLLQKLTASNVGAISLVGFLMIRIYSGWGYVAARLTSKVIEYEETGWYDGDFELKSETELRRDRFLYKDKVQPVVNRLKTLSLGLGALWLASIAAFNASAQLKPLVDQYDPKMLERLNYDEKLAEKMAESSGGKPIYCDNRYYRAVAGGGQGCD